MNSYCKNRRRFHRGGILITTLAFAVVISLVLAGIATLTVSHYGRVQVETDYTMALDLAEAGINYEFRKISASSGTADQAGSSNPPGVSYNLENGSFRVYCTNRDGSTPWVAPSNLYVISTGTIHGVSRTVRVSVKGYGSTTSANYALFGINQGLMNSSTTTVGGDVGTNGFFTFNGHPTITGSVNFNGSGSNWQSPPTGTYTVNYNASAVSWPTVTSIANNAFSGGLNYLANNNDNGLAVPPISGNFILLNSGTLTFKGKASGANYYITSLTCNGSSQIAFDNSAGPITIWMGPAGSSSTFVFNGGTAAIKASTDSTKPVRIYVATNNDVILNGNAELDAGIYNYNSSSSGRVILNGSPNVYGSIISYMFTLNSSPYIHYVPGYFTSNSSGTGYYGYDDQWLEQNGR